MQKLCFTLEKPFNYFIPLPHSTSHLYCMSCYSTTVICCSNFYPRTLCQQGMCYGTVPVHLSSTHW